MVKSTLKSKTIWLGLVVGIFGSILATLPLLQESMDQQTYGLIFMGISVMIVVLRFYTDTALKDK